MWDTSRCEFSPAWPARRRGASLVAVVAVLAGVLAAPAAWGVNLVEHEDAQLELYGILDVGLGYLEHSYSGSDVLASTVNSYNLNSSPHSFTGLYSGGASMSRVGLRGAFRFGSGQQVFFRLESAINVTTGVLSNNGQAIYNNLGGLHSANSASAINGQLFARAAYLGVSDPTWGSLELGRTTNFSLDQTAQYDPLQAALLYSPVGYSGGIGGGLGATENSRLDESVRYENHAGPVRFGAQYKLAGDKGAQSAGYGWVGMLAFTQGGFSIEGTYSEMTNSVTWPVQYSNVVKPDPNVQLENTKGYMVTAMYTAGKATAKAGWEDITVSAPSNPNLTVRWYYGLLLPKPSVNASGEQFLDLYWVGGDYRFTRQFNVEVAFYNIDTYNRPEVGKAYWAQAYSLLADYQFTPGFDTYLGIMVMEYSGAGLDKHAPVNAYSSNGMYGIGVRYHF
ncbi:MAG: porin [Gammaproteobacteria bacterium]|nr:porin [Gammaproteobacteria bacterium]